MVYFLHLSRTEWFIVENDLSVSETDFSISGTILSLILRESILYFQKVSDIFLEN